MSMMPNPQYEAYIDGASHGNPGPAGIGVVLFHRPASGGVAAVPVRELSQPLGVTTNNVAEYMALIYALQEALADGCANLTVRSDSELLVRQVSGQYAVREATLRLLHGLVRHLIGKFQHVIVEHVPRAHNGLADRLATRAAKRSL